MIIEHRAKTLDYQLSAQRAPWSIIEPMFALLTEPCMDHFDPLGVWTVRPSIAAGGDS